MTVWIEDEGCDGCSRCIRACPYDAVELREGKAFLLDRCTYCGACFNACKQELIKTDAKPRAIPDFTDRKGVWVFAEQRNGNLTQVSLELLGKAGELAGILGQEVCALLLGDRVAGLSDALVEHGADKVYLAQDKALKDYRTIAYTDVMDELVTLYRPNILLMGATHIGRDLAPRLARRIGSGLTADCTGLSIDQDEGILLQTRPAFGGNVMATIANRYSRPQMATVRPGVMEPHRIPGKKGAVIIHYPSMAEEAIGTQILERVKEKKKGVDISRAKIIVAGGRGVGNAEGFAMLGKLAQIMGGEVAGTRVAVEEGWIVPEQQVGQTGRSVRPELYIACGISGAVQHRAGMINSRYIIAINKDPAAPIFQVADWAVIADLYDIIPEMIDQLNKEGVNL